MLISLSIYMYIQCIVGSHSCREEKAIITAELEYERGEYSSKRDTTLYIEKDFYLKEVDRLESRIRMLEGEKDLLKRTLQVGFS
jgi:hypothetical protein